MRPHRMFTIVGLLLALSSLHAQTASDPSGHWSGAVQVPGGEVAIEADLTRAASGSFGGTIGVPAQNLKGLPLLKVVVDGQAVSFHARRDQTFAGVVSEDGRSMAGDFTIDGSTLRFSLVRTGEAVIEPALKSAPISKELEGTWNGTVDANGKQLRVVLTLANQADGVGAIGRLIHLDEGGLEIPVAITCKATHVTLAAAVVPGSFAGDLNADGTVLSGTWRQGDAAVPVTFRRAP